MKHNIAVYIIIFVVAVLCGTAVLAQAGLDDQGKANDPRSNARANACYTEGSLAGSCVTEAQWDCGWSLIRFEYGLLSSLPTSCASLFPNVRTTSGQNPFLSVTAFDANMTPTVYVPPTNNKCAWVWATQTQTELAQQAQSAVSAAGLTVINLYAATYGENCVKTNGEIVEFAAQYTAFDVTISVDATTNQDAARQTVINAINSLSTIPGGSAPQITVHFITSGPTVTPPTVTPTTPDTQCAWSWATQPQPELAQRASAAVSAAGYTADVYAYLYGENCYTRDGKFVRFAAMDTNFNVTVTVAADTDQVVARQAVYSAILGLSGMPTSKVNINMSFVVADPTVVPTIPTEAPTQEVTPEASPDVDTTSEPLPPTEEVTPEATVAPMPTATPRTGDCKPTDPCGM